MNQYEGMFVFDPTFASEQSNIDSALEHVMTRGGGVVTHVGKWDERKLAYEIDNRKRGCYVLVYFKAPPESIAGMERDCRLHNDILRVLITRNDGLSEERQAQMISEAPAGSRKERDAAPRAERPAAEPEVAPAAAETPTPAEATEASTAVLDRNESDEKRPVDEAEGA